MPTIASGSRVRLLYVAESTRGTTPSTPTMKVLRTTSRGINLEKGEVASEEVRSDRQVADYRHGFNRIAGSIATELSLNAMDDMLEAALAGTWATGTSVGTVVSTVASDQTFTRSSGSFVTDGYRPGHIITAAGFSASNNNGDFRVTEVTSTKLTVVGAAALTDEAAGAGKSVIQKGGLLEIGTSLRTFSIERQFLDIAQYQLFRGVAVNRMTLSVQPEEIVKMDLELIGMSAAALSGSTAASSVTAAATNVPMSAFDGEIYEGAAASSIVTGLNLTLENSRSVVPIVGEYTSPDVFEGTAMVTGEITVFFQNATQFNKFKNETESSVWVRIDDPDDTSKFINICLPRIKYSAANIDPPRDGPVSIAMPFKALVHPTYQTSLFIQRSV